MESVGIRELKNNTSKVVKSVCDNDAEVIVTVRGVPVAVLRPFDDSDREKQARRARERDLDRLDELAVLIGEAWTSPKSAVELVDEQRRG